MNPPGEIALVQYGHLKMLWIFVSSIFLIQRLRKPFGISSSYPSSFWHAVCPRFFFFFFWFIYLFVIILPLGLLPSVRPATFSGKVERKDSVGTIITNSKVQKWRFIIFWPSQVWDQDWNTIMSLKAKLHTLCSHFLWWPFADQY